MMQDRITAQHRRRGAVVYIRQSTAGQLTQNVESQRRQYALVDHARSLGFQSVEVIDDDLGRSGSGLVERPGFQRLVAKVCAGETGAVVSIEASRLARNGRDWHHLIELCGLVDTLVIDPDGVYSPQLTNDRLLLGLKGTMSEFELNLLRQRSLEALRQKARRGELRFSLPAGYRWTHHGKIEMEPDERVRKAILSIFEKFTELGSMRQVLLYFRGEERRLPVASYNEFGRSIVWRLPVYGTIRGILTNPIYAGAYAFGRRERRIRIVDGKARRTDGHLKRREDWMVLIRDHHPGYISWERFERNQNVIAGNAHSKPGFGRKAGRGGRSLLAGLIRCGRCGRMLHVAYGGERNPLPRYHCRGAAINHGTGKCISFGGLKVDRTIGDEVLRAVSGDAVEAALEAAGARSRAVADRMESLRLDLDQARYEAGLAARRYDAVDPDQRLVAAELEARWNAALERVHDLERRIGEEEKQTDCTATPDRDSLLRLAADLPAVWNAPSTDMRLKQRIVHLLIEEVIADVDEQGGAVVLVVHWAGGCHSELRVAKNKTGQHRKVTQPEAIGIIRQMAARYSDAQIAWTLNRLGLRTGAGNTWVEHRVRWVRHYRRLPAFDPTGKDPSRLTLEGAARALEVSEQSVRRLIREGVLPATQIVPSAPWEIQEEALDLPAVRQAATDLKHRRYKPSARSSEQQDSLFSSV